MIRLATSGDIAGIAPLVENYWAFESIGGFDRSRIERLLHDLLSDPARGAGWVADVEGRIYGYLLVVFMLSLEHGGWMAEIDEVFVSPEARCAGIGSLLLESAERDLCARGLVRLQLQLETGNRRARTFYERHGFGPRADYRLFDKPLHT